MVEGYAKLESHIIDLFNQYKKFQLNDKVYNILEVGKPRPRGQSGGESKTDVYVLGEDSDGEKTEIKISVKSKNTNEFQGNKFKPEDAEDLLGKDWKYIISQATQNIAELFEDQYLMYADKKGRIQANSISMGWKLEVASKPRKLSAPLPLNEQEIRDLVYKGTKQPNEKKDAVVNDYVRFGSGIAEYILYSEIEELNNVADIIEKMFLIDDLNITENSTYLIFTANNWRTEVDKTDGKRYLAVIVEWELINGKLQPKLIYDEPLSRTGHDNKFHLQDLFKQLGVDHPSDLQVGTQIDERHIFKRE